jgi:hypothetical protein
MVMNKIAPQTKHLSGYLKSAIQSENPDFVRYMIDLGASVTKAHRTLARKITNAEVKELIIPTKITKSIPPAQPKTG